MRNVWVLLPSHISRRDWIDLQKGTAAGIRNAGRMRRVEAKLLAIAVTVLVAKVVMAAFCSNRR